MSVSALNEALKQHLAAENIQALALSLGYSDPKTFAEHLSQIVDQPFLGLDRGFYDLHYGSRGLIQKLAVHFEIEPGLLDRALAYIDEVLNHYNHFEPVVYVDFEMSEQTRKKSLINRMPLAQRLRINLDFADFSLEPEAMLPGVQTKVCEHYLANHIFLAEWGRVKGYIFKYQPEQCWHFDTHGNLLGQGDCCGGFDWGFCVNRKT